MKPTTAKQERSKRFCGAWMNNYEIVISYAPVGEEALAHFVSSKISSINEVRGNNVLPSHHSTNRDRIEEKEYCLLARSNPHSRVLIFWISRVLSSSCPSSKMWLLLKPVITHLSMEQSMSISLLLCPPPCSGEYWESTIGWNILTLCIPDMRAAIMQISFTEPVLAYTEINMDVLQHKHICLRNVVILCQRNHGSILITAGGVACCIPEEFRMYRSISVGAYCAELNWKPLQFSWYAGLWDLPPFRKFHVL